jgi:hypothetical protein
MITAGTIFLLVGTTIRVEDLRSEFKHCHWCRIRFGGERFIPKSLFTAFLKDLVPARSLAGIASEGGSHLVWTKSFLAGSSLPAKKTLR